jgi:hypothetical protein
LGPSSAEAITAFERCERYGYYSKRWTPHKVTPTRAVQLAVTQALVEPHDNPGENAGDILMGLAANPGLETTAFDVYTSAVNHAAIADIVTTAIGVSWKLLESEGNFWHSSALIAPDGRFLRRFLPCSTWNDTRKYSEIYSWFGLGEVAHYGLPMQLVVANIGQNIDGRRHGPWSRGLFHPNGAKLRFKRRGRGGEFAGEKWDSIWREELDRISREQWLQAMLDDGVLQESLFVVTIPVPPEEECRKIKERAQVKLEQVSKLTTLPDKQFATCFDPVQPCSFRGCCHAQPELTPEAHGGFDALP